MTDRDSVLAVLTDAAWIFDHREWNRMADVFTPDAVAYGQRGLDAITTNTIRYLGRCGPSQHLIGNHRIAIDGDAATAISYIRAFHSSPLGQPAQHWDFLGEYHDELRRTRHGWRISQRVCIPLASTGDLDLLASR